MLLLVFGIPNIVFTLTAVIITIGSMVMGIFLLLESNNSTGLGSICLLFLAIIFLIVGIIALFLSILLGLVLASQLVAGILTLKGKSWKLSLAFSIVSVCTSGIMFIVAGFFTVMFISGDTGNSITLALMIAFPFIMFYELISMVVSIIASVGVFKSKSAFQSVVKMK